MLGAQRVADGVKFGGPEDEQTQCAGDIRERFLEEGAWRGPEQQEMIFPFKKKVLF